MKRVFFSTIIESDNVIDILNHFSENVPENFVYEYMEDVPEIEKTESSLRPLFEGIGDVFSGKSLK